MVNDNRYCTTTRENNDAADRYRTFSWLFLFWKHSEQFYMAGYSLVDWICRGDRLATDSGRWRTAGTLFVAGFNPAGDSLDCTADFPLHILGTVGVRSLVWMAGGVRWYGDRCILEQKRTGRYRTGSGICFPQMLVYSVAYFGLLLLLVAWQKLRKERRNAVVMHRNRNGKTLAVFVFLLLCNTGIYTMGIWLELVVNPWVATFSMQLPIK